VPGRGSRRRSPQAVERRDWVKSRAGHYASVDLAPWIVAAVREHDARSAAAAGLADGVVAYRLGVTQAQVTAARARLAEGSGGR
jgi:hypothetical protein